MSKQIDFSKPLSDEDRQYLLDRGQDAVVDRVDESHARKGKKAAEQPAAAAAAESEPDTEWFGPARPEDGGTDEDWLEAWTVPQLKAQLDFYKVQYKSSASKQDLKDALYDFLDEDSDVV